MSSDSPLWAIIVIGTCILTGAAISRSIKTLENRRRYETLDGLRGLAALGVYTCHCLVFYKYLKEGAWGPPDSYLYSQLGEASVTMFFMITAFLFSERLYRSRSNPIDWAQYYKSRILRLYPTYLVATAILVIITWDLSGFRLNVPLPAYLLQIAQWATFGIFGLPDINEVNHTITLGLGVAWTLQYEWLFYSLLPIAALFLRHQCPLWVIVPAALILCAFTYTNPIWSLLTCFGMGFFAMIACNIGLTKSIANSSWGSALIISFLVALAYTQPTGYSLASIVLIGISFTIIAAGNDFFGLLTYKPVILLGKISYSVYLIHGFALFSTFHYIYGFEKASKLPVSGYWLTIVLISPILIVIAFLSYKRLELPFIKRAHGTIPGTFVTTDHRD